MVEKKMRHHGMPPRSRTCWLRILFRDLSQSCKVIMPELTLSPGVMHPLSLTRCLAYPVWSTYANLPCHKRFQPSPRSYQECGNPTLLLGYSLWRLCCGMRSTLDTQPGLAHNSPHSVRGEQKTR